MINPEDISVVVQGAVGKETARCLRSIRKHLPGAEIILSTWQGTDVNGLDYDKLVLSEDPGGIIHRMGCAPNNVNRQLISTQAGLQIAKRKYTLKLRTDLIIQSTNFLKYFDKFPVRNPEYSIFKHRVIISTVYAREQYLGSNFLFHPSDFWFFGLTDDICDYWMKTEKQETCTHVISGFRITGNSLIKYVPEQYYCINWAHRRFPNIVFNDCQDDNYDATVASLNILYNNFIFIGPYQAGIWSKKHKKAYRNEYSFLCGMKGLITYELFQQRYKELCDTSYLPNTDKYKYLYKMRRSYTQVLQPLRYIVKWFIWIFRSVYYTASYLIHCLKNNKG